MVDIDKRTNDSDADLPTGFKMTELGPLPEEWEVVRLREVAEYMKAGGTPKTSEASFWSGKIPFVKVEDVAKPGIYLIGTTSYITEQGLKNSNTWLVPKNSILLSMYGTAGEVKITGREVAISQNVLGIIPNENVFLVEFAYYALLWARNYTLHLITDVTIFKHFTLAKAKQLVLPLPPLHEQRAIAHVLRTVQRAKEATERVIQATRELKKSLMRYLFTYGPVPMEEAERVPLKETEIGLVPEHWEVVRLGEVCLKPQYGFTASATNQRVGPKFLRITDIQNSQVNWNTVPYCEISDELLKRYRLEPGDLLFARIGATTGKTLLIRECPEAIFASYLIRVRVNLNLLLPEFLFYFTQGNLYWSQINTAKGGRLKQGINIPVLSSLLVPLPPISEQRIIARILEAVDKKLQVEEARKQVLDALFNSLLHNLMTAKIRVKDLNLYNIDIIQRR